MSNEAITWAYRQPITTGAKFVLVALADMADEAHSCFPGQAKLATMTGQGERTVRRQLAELELAGYLHRARRFDGAGHRTSDRYTLPVGQEIPTGQSDQRPNQPAANTATGQTGQRPDTTIPTGHHGRVSLRRTQRTPQPPASGGPTRRRANCPKHVRHNTKCPECVRLQERDDRQATWPPWCGSCDENTRKRADELRSRCPDCHPLRRTA